MLDISGCPRYVRGMNKLDNAKRSLILNLLMVGSSMRAISRIADVSINTVAKHLAEAGEEFHDANLKGVAAKRVQCDEIWSFVYAKAKNVGAAIAAPEGAGDCWTWTALDADSKLMIAWTVGGRDASYANDFMKDVASRLTRRVQLTTDGHAPYLEAVEGAFGNDIDYARLVKVYGDAPGTGRYSPGVCLGADKRPVTGRPNPDHISTSTPRRKFERS